MMRQGLSIVALGLCAMANGQWWMDAGLPIQMANGVTRIFSDTTTGTIYCTGDLRNNVWSPEAAFHYAAYQGGNWMVSDPFNQIVQTSIVWNDTFIVGGMFTQVNGQPVANIACLVNGEWLPFGNLDHMVKCLRIIDGELYATGAFRIADGHVCNGVAKRVGGEWVNVGFLPDADAYVQDIAGYNGDIYVVGALHYEGIGAHGVVRFDGQQWLPAGNGILGGFAVGLCLEEYQGELYMGGMIDIAVGNPGHAIMRWNGTEWYSVGTGVQDIYGGYNYLYTVSDLEVHNGLLYASGGFNFAGNVPAEYIATWDGQRWCGLGGTFNTNGPVYSVGFLGDTLFVGCGNSADGQPVNHLARYIGEEWGGPCSVPMGGSGVGMAPPPNKEKLAHLANLGNGQYRVVGEVTGRELRVFDASGRLQRVLLLHPGPSGTEPFSLADLAAGSYVLDLGGQWRGRVVLAP